MRYCTKCGAPIKDGKSFCTKCGAPVKEKRIETAAEQPKTEHSAQQQPREEQIARVYAPVNEHLADAGYAKQPAQLRPKKKKWKAVIITAVSLAAAFALFWFFGLPLIKNAQPVSGSAQKLSDRLPTLNYSYLTSEPEVQVEYEAEETIYPSLYNTTDSILHFTATGEGGERDVMVKVEVPGFTQVYEQKFTLGSQITQFYVHPPVLTEKLDLNSAKDAQIVFSVTDIDSGKPIVKDTRPVKLMSKFDMPNYDPALGASSWDYYLAWLTPEAPGVLEVKRAAVDWISNYSGGQFSTMPGYQDTGLFEGNVEMNTYYQALAVQGAMNDMGIRYNNAWYSMSGGGDKILQRVQLPDDTISSKSGVCIETALVMASALQSSGMNVMLVFPPGHTQVAVEAWPNTGEYFLIETTTLPVTEENLQSIVTYKTKEEWIDYIQNGYGDGSGGCYVLDCALTTPLGLLPLSN